MPITRTARRSPRSMLSRNAQRRVHGSADHLFKFNQASHRAQLRASTGARVSAEYTYTGTHTRMQHRRERPTPRRQTHPPETPQTHLHPPSRPALASPSFKPFPPCPPPVPRAWRHPNRSPRFANPHHPPYYSPVSSDLSSFPPSPSAFSLSSLTVAALSYTTRLDPRPFLPLPPRAHPVRQPTTPTYRSDPRAISKIIPYILELWRTILLILILLLHGG